MITNVEYFPFGEDVKYAVDTTGENVYFQILMIFDYEEIEYVVVQETINNHVWLGTLNMRSEESTRFDIIPVMDDDLLDKLFTSIEEYEKQRMN